MGTFTEYEYQVWDYLVDAERGGHFLAFAARDWEEGWPFRVDLARLDMRSDEDSVLGQLFGSRAAGLATLRLVGGYKQGFALRPSGLNVLAGRWLRLRAAWLKLISVSRPDEPCPDCGMRLGSGCLHGYLSMMHPGQACPGSRLD